jgi:tRNA A37 threonylcarbamoyladenosine modification protein TsaB
MKSEKVVISVYSDSYSGYVAASVGDTRFSELCNWTSNYTPTMGIVPLLQQFAKKIGINIRSVDTIVAAKGPSPFTIQRVLLTVAKALYFCAPNAKIFSPSNFHVLAHATKERVSGNNCFFVLINSYSQGFFGAKFQKASGESCILLEASFHDKNLGADFLRSNATALFVTDFSEELLEQTLLHYLPSENIIRLPSVNLALAQIDLFASSVSRNDFDYESLEPYRLHPLAYKKIPAVNVV